MKSVDLCAGIGGIRLGFEQNGVETVYANDIDSRCGITYDLNFPTSPLTVKDIKFPPGQGEQTVLEDIEEVDYDILTAGFPCQAFSVAGYRQGFRDNRGRGDLFFYLAEVLQKTEPESFLLENVKNLYTHDSGRTYRIIENSLTGLGYNVTTKVLNSMEYGNVPQNRERIYIVGFKNKKSYYEFKFPERIPRTVNITDILEDEVGDEFYYEDSNVWDQMRGYPFKEGVAYQWRRRYIRENKSGVFPTLTANMGTGGHNVPLIKDKKGVRKLTPQECFRVQGFPEEYKLPDIARTTLYEQIGNAVTVPVIQRIAQNILNVV